MTWPMGVGGGRLVRHGLGLPARIRVISLLQALARLPGHKFQSHPGVPPGRLIDPDFLLQTWINIRAIAPADRPFSLTAAERAADSLSDG